MQYSNIYNELRERKVKENVEVVFCILGWISTFVAIGYFGAHFVIYFSKLWF